MQFMIWPNLIKESFQYVLICSLILFVICIIVDKIDFSYKLSYIIKKFLSVFVICVASFYALIFLIASFFAPQQLSVYPLELSQASNIATSINGLMTPFIAIAAAILTFMAFWVQYTANQEMLKNNSKQQLERQFYELLKIHREMVNEFEWEYLDSEMENPSSYNVYKNGFQPYIVQGIAKNYAIYRHRGQSTIRIFLKEFCFICECIQNLKTTEKKENVFLDAYKIFFEGMDKAVKECDLNLNETQISCLKKVKLAINLGKGKIIETDFFKKYGFKRCNIFEGHRSVLNPYYRHLFLMVKNIATSNFFNNDEKMSFLKTLRAQMTAEEQMLLYYNWLSGYGTEWEERRGNRFFTRYKMIHNIERIDWSFFSAKPVEIFPWMTKDEAIGLFEFKDRIVKYEKMRKREQIYKKVKDKIDFVACVIIKLCNMT